MHQKLVVETPIRVQKVTGMTNEKSKWIVGQMCRFGLDFNSAVSVWLIVLALHQVTAVETLMRVQR